MILETKFKIFFLSISTILSLSIFHTTTLSAQNEIKTTDFEISFNEKKYLAKAFEDSKFPSKQIIFVLHDIWGRTSFEEDFSSSLAKEGYLVIALDIYGMGRNSTTAEGSNLLVTESDQRGIEQILDLVKEFVKYDYKLKTEDKENVSLIGFGYGGGISVNLGKRDSRIGSKQIKSIFSFYGGLKKILPIEADTKNKAQIFYFRPLEDAYVTKEEIQEFKKEFKSSKNQPLFFEFKGSHYGFMNKSVEKLAPGTKTFMYYSKSASEQSFKILLKNLK